MTNNQYTREDYKIAKLLWDAADDEGTIEAGDMQSIAPHDRPELHTTMNMSTAFELLTGKRYDSDALFDV